MTTVDNKPLQQRHRIAWVDMLRGACLLAILWFHTEMYYAGTDITPYAFYVGDVLATFFFLSGYVSYREEVVDVRQMLYGVFRWLLVPYFVFTSLIALPKAIVHNAYEGVVPLLANILSGHASWFVSSLIVARLMFIAVSYLSRSSSWALLLTALLALLLSSFVGNSLSESYYMYDFWCVNEALLGYFFMVAGWFFRRYEPLLGRHFRSVTTLLYITLLVVMSKIAIVSTDAEVVFGLIRVSNYPLFVFDLLVSILFLVSIAMRLPSVRPLTWVGKRSLVYYFFCGGCPLLVGKALRAVGFGYEHYLQIPLAFAIVVTFATVLVWLVYRFTPIMRRHSY